MQPPSNFDQPPAQDPASPPAPGWAPPAPSPYSPVLPPEAVPGFRHLAVVTPRPALPAWARALLFLLMAGGVYLGTQLVAGVVVVLASGGLSLGPGGGDRVERLLQSPGILAPIEWATAIAMFVVAVLFWAFLDRRPFDEFAMAPRPGWLRQVGLGLFLGTVPFLALLAFYVATGHVRIHGWAHETWAGRGLYLITLALFCTAVGFAEEIPYRGYLLPNLNEAIGRRWGMALMALLFLFPHLFNPRGHDPLNIASIFLAAVTLGLLALGTGSLWAPVAMHAVYDLMVFTFSPNTMIEPLLRITTHGPAWLYGGTDQAGLIDLLAELAVMGAVWRWVYVPGIRRETGGGRVE